MPLWCYEWQSHVSKYAKIIGGSVWQCIMHTVPCVSVCGVCVSTVPCVSVYTHSAVCVGVGGRQPNFFVCLCKRLHIGWCKRLHIGWCKRLHIGWCKRLHIGWCKRLHIGWCKRLHRLVVWGRQPKKLVKFLKIWYNWVKIKRGFQKCV